MGRVERRRRIRAGDPTPKPSTTSTTSTLVPSSRPTPEAFERDSLPPAAVCVLRPSVQTPINEQSYTYQHSRTILLLLQHLIQVVSPDTENTHNSNRHITARHLPLAAHGAPGLLSSGLQLAALQAFGYLSAHLSQYNNHKNHLQSALEPHQFY